MCSSPYCELGPLLHLSDSQFAVKLGDRMILPSVSHPLSVGPGMLSGSNIASKVEAETSIYIKLQWAKVSQISEF